MLRHKIIKAKNKDLLCDLLWNLWLMSIDFVTNCCLPLREVVSWNEIRVCIRPHFRQSTSAWGSELKLLTAAGKDLEHCLPLREVVSWNTSRNNINVPWSGLPLREVVSWNISGNLNSPARSMSTSAWGSELKCISETKITGMTSSTSAWGSELKYHKELWNRSKCFVYLCVR